MKFLEKSAFSICFCVQYICFIIIIIIIIIVIVIIKIVCKTLVETSCEGKVTIVLEQQVRN
jgi:hypothetical protein